MGIPVGGVVQAMIVTMDRCLRYATNWYSIRREKSLGGEGYPQLLSWVAVAVVTPAAAAAEAAIIITIITATRTTTTENTSNHAMMSFISNYHFDVRCLFLIFILMFSLGEGC